MFVSCTIPFLINTIETNDTFSYIAYKYYALKNMNTKKVYFGLCCEQYWSLFHEWGGGVAVESSVKVTGPS